MTTFDHLVIGGGMAADAAVRGIRAVDPATSVGLLSAEPHPPYDRPPLSKGLWAGMDEHRIWRETGREEVDLLLGRRAVALDPRTRTVEDDAGARHRYGHLLLATGGDPVRLPGAHPEVIHFRTLDDYRRLREGTGPGSRVVVVGGGFIGSELAAGLRMAEREVVIVFPEDGIAERILPRRIALRLNRRYEEEGVEVRPRTLVTGVVRAASGRFRVRGRSGGEEVAIDADAVVAGVGIRPATELASSAGLRVEDGIVTDGYLRTADPRILAAGDVARVPCPALGRSVRVEHEDHANSSGMIAGMVMAGEERPYEHLPFFYSDLFDTGYQAVGETDPARLETRAVRADGEERGVIYYLDRERIRGVLLWNVRKRLRRARALVEEGARIPSDPDEVEALIPVED